MFNQTCLNALILILKPGIKKMCWGGVGDDILALPFLAHTKIMNCFFNSSCILELVERFVVVVGGKDGLYDVLVNNTILKICKLYNTLYQYYTKSKQPKTIVKQHKTAMLISDLIIKSWNLVSC
jgi:hypothetical protein